MESFNTHNNESGLSFKPTSNAKEVDSLNEILRGEIAAVEAYAQILENFDSDPERLRLEEFLNFHKKQVSYFTDKVENKGYKADDDSSLWGNVVEAFIGTAKLFGDDTSLSAMIAGEEYGLKQYNNLIWDDNVSPELKSHVSKNIIPELELHVNSLKALKKLD